MLTDVVAIKALKADERRKAFHTSVHDVLERNKANIHEGTVDGDHCAHRF